MVLHEEIRSSREICEHGPGHAQGQEDSGVLGLYHGLLRDEDRQESL